MDPAIWFRLQEDQVREGATSMRRHQGYQALLPRTPARLEMRRNFFSNRVVGPYNSLPDSVKMAISMNSFKAGLDEHMGTPAPIQRRGGRRDAARPRYGGGEEEGGRPCPDIHYMPQLAALWIKRLIKTNKLGLQLGQAQYKLELDCA